MGVRWTSLGLDILVRGTHSRAAYNLPDLSVRQSSRRRYGMLNSPEGGANARGVCLRGLTLSRWAVSRVRAAVVECR